MAIKANEIRVGNWLASSLLKTTTYHQVDTHFFRQLVFNSRDEDMPVLHFAWESIPLTPEILEKAGFQWNDHEERYMLLSGNILFESNQDGTVSCGTNDSFVRPIGIPVNSLHLLMNLYFALTGEELTINL